MTRLTGVATSLVVLACVAGCGRIQAHGSVDGDSGTALLRLARQSGDVTRTVHLPASTRTLSLVSDCTRVEGDVYVEVDGFATLGQHCSKDQHTEESLVSASTEGSRSLPRTVTVHVKAPQGSSWTILLSSSTAGVH